MLTGLKRKLTTYFSPEIQKTIKPQTYSVETGGDRPKFFGEKQRNRKRIEEFIRIHEQGGLISEAIDLYPLFMFSKGYTWDGEPGAIDACKEFMSGFDYQHAFNLAVTSPLVCGDGFQEIVLGRGGQIVGLLYRDPTYWRIEYDQYGLVSGYTQATSNILLNKEQTFDPNRIFHTQMIPSLREGYGTSLIQRAIDDIKRDARIAEGSSNAIDRHGTPKWDVTVGDPDKPVADNIITYITRKLEDLNSRNEAVHHAGIKITTLDTAGVGNIASYQDFALVRVCGAMGVPGELLGFRQGTTDNTAVSRIGAFLQKCDTFNQRFARALNVQVFDQITGKTGAARIKFNSVMPSQQAEMATWIVNLIKANPMDPEAYCPTEWVRQVLGIPDKIEETRESEYFRGHAHRLGGQGSGNFDHLGRPGEVGGSIPGIGAEMISSAGKYYDEKDPKHLIQDGMPDEYYDKIDLSFKDYFQEHSWSDASGIISPIKSAIENAGIGTIEYLANGDEILGFGEQLELYLEPLSNEDVEEKFSLNLPSFDDVEYNLTDKEIHDQIDAAFNNIDVTTSDVVKNIMNDWDQISVPETNTKQDVEIAKYAKDKKKILNAYSTFKTKLALKRDIYHKKSKMPLLVKGN